MQDNMLRSLTGANVASIAAFRLAQEQLRRYIGDPGATIEEAIAASPGMTMAHIFKAYLNLLGTEPAGAEAARAACKVAAALPATAHEAAHLKAATLLAHGHWFQAGRVLEDVALAHPTDLVALQVGHQIDFFVGDSRMLRDRIARALPAWSASMPGYHAMLSMHAFGLEETGDYDKAQRYGTTAVELEPRDGWAWHAVAHVHEMRNQPAAGLKWLGAQPEVWSHESFFAVHNWWHLALFHLELGQLDEVLALYDRAIGGPGSSVVLDMIDATAMLWRLSLRGIDVGGRWAPLADRWKAVIVPGQYAFNDMHAAMAYTGAGRLAECRELAQAQTAALAGDADNAVFTRDTGKAAVEAIHAFADGDFARATTLLRDIRSRASRFGGSHAQRDILDLTLIEAARRGKQQDLAQGLAWERASMRPFAARSAA